MSLWDNAALNVNMVSVVSRHFSQLRVGLIAFQTVLELFPTMRTEGDKKIFHAGEPQSSTD